MRPFTYSAADTATAAIQQAGVADRAAQSNGATSHANGLASRANGMASHVATPAQFLAGGTNLLDLMKLDVMRPSHLVDINPLAADPMASRIVANEHGLRIGTAVKMSEAASDPTIKRDYPVLAQTLSLAASSGLRNMASLGGNMLQRTRCAYFRDTSIKQCNKREPGSGCAALDGVNRTHAVLGVSDQCIASYPGDFAQALMALDAVLEIQGRGGSRAIPFAKLHVEPGATPDVETTLKPGELIVAINVPAGAAKRSVYVKVRDRQSYAFALASAAVVLDMDGDTVRRVRIALGGVASVPWRAKEAETALTGHPLNEQTATAAADAAFAGASTCEHNAYKVPLGKETLVRALLHAATMEA